MVAVATTWRTAERSPPTMMGSPSGISTRVRICHSVRPTARAASIVPRSTDSTPAYAPARSGGMARITSTMMTGAIPTPSHSAKRTSSPRVGRARSAPVVLTTRNENRPVCPM
jgi:hypothetical protein